MTQARFVYRLLLAFGVALLITIVLLTVVWVKLSNDEAQSCRIQQKGLPAGRLVAAIFADSSALFSAPTTAAQRRQQAALTPAQIRRERRLKDDLAAYQTIERSLPRSRQC